MMPSLPSAIALTAVASVTIENTISEAAATARGVGAKAVEHAKAFDRAVGDRHATREALNRVIRPNRDDPDVQRLCRLAFRDRHAAEGADRFAKSAIDLRCGALRGEDKAIDIAAEPHRIQPKHPLIAFGC